MTLARRNLPAIRDAEVGAASFVHTWIWTRSSGSSLRLPRHTPEPESGTGCSFRRLAT